MRCIAIRLRVGHALAIAIKRSKPEMCCTLTSKTLLVRKERATMKPFEYTRTWLIVIFVAFASIRASAAELEPRYWWQPNITQQLFPSTDEAFAYYKHWWEVDHNAPPGSGNYVSVLSYDLVGSPGIQYYVINNNPTQYQIKYTTVSMAPKTLYGGSLNLVTECPLGTTLNWTSLGNGVMKYVCIEPSAPDPDLNICPTGNPVYPSTGLKFQVETDYESGRGELAFKRTYRSDRNGWRNNFQISAVDVSSALGSPSKTGGACKAGIGGTSKLPYCFRYISSQPNDFVLERSDGRLVRFDNSTGLPRSADSNDRLSKVVDQNGNVLGWEVYDSADDSTDRFDITGRLVWIAGPNGQKQTLTYSDVSTPASVAPFPGLLTTISDQHGKQLHLEYDQSGRLRQLTDPLAVSMSTFTMNHLRLSPPGLRSRAISHQSHILI